ncbi:TetR/AcrR family transcriptional regulator [Kibdelosporangium lantanae]
MPYHHGDLRDALLDAAETLIREQGVNGWSLREASAKVGVSPSAAYHHFASRDDLVRALSDRVLVRLAHRLARSAGHARGDSHARLVALGRTYVRWALADPAVARLVLSVGSSGALSPHPHEVLAAELRRLGLPPGSDFVVWSAIHGLATLLVDGLMRVEGHRAVDRQAERVVRAVLSGLAVEEEDAWPAARSAHTERAEP